MSNASRSRRRCAKWLRFVTTGKAAEITPLAVRDARPVFITTKLRHRSVRYDDHRIHYRLDTLLQISLRVAGLLVGCN